MIDKQKTVTRSLRSYLELFFFFQIPRKPSSPGPGDTLHFILQRDWPKECDCLGSGELGQEPRLSFSCVHCGTAYVLRKDELVNDSTVTRLRSHLLRPTQKDEGTMACTSVTKSPCVKGSAPSPAVPLGVCSPRADLD